jgi:hypothetical protein
MIMKLRTVVKGWPYLNRATRQTMYFLSHRALEQAKEKNRRKSENSRRPVNPSTKKG